VSGFTQTTDELLYAFYGAATVSSPTVSPGSTITATYPPIEIPANTFTNVGSRSTSLKFEIGGLATVTAAIPTWQFFLYIAVATTSAPAFATTTTLGSSPTFTPGQAATNFPWDLSVNIGLRTLALGAASTITCQGWAESYAFTPAAYSATAGPKVFIPATGAYTPLATYDTTQAYLLWPALSLSAATAGNTVTVEYAKLYGEN
jgi:hypothetical protein